MDFALDDDQREIQALLREALSSRMALTDVAAVADGSPIPGPVWQMLADELGVFGLCLPEAVGGQDRGWVELVLVLEECGRAVVPAPVRETMLALRALTRAGQSGQVAELLSQGRIVAVGDGGDSLPRIDGDEVAGDLHAVPYAADAQHLLVIARTEDGPAADTLALVDCASAGFTTAPIAELDPTRRSRSVSLRQVPVTGRASGESAVEILRGEATLGLAAEMLGLAQRCLDLTVEHVGAREQFGHPIGSFQAVKHQCADMLVEIELARTAVYLAACRAQECLGRDAPDAAALHEIAGSAFGQAARAGKLAAAGGVQLHGGIGFTWEHPLHLLVKRLRTGAHLGAT